MSYIVHKAVDLDKVKKKLRPTEAQLTHEYLAQPKYDGCAMVAFKRSQAGDGASTADCVLHTDLRSRTNEVVSSATHIQEALAKAPFLPLGVYFGEYWHPKIPQNVLSGHFRDTKEQHPHAYFVVFDYVTQAEFDAGHSSLTYEQRVARIPNLFFSIQEFTAPVFAAETQGFLVDHELFPMEAARLFKDYGGYDGLILRKPTGTWTKGDRGTNGEVIKIKPTLTFDLRIISTEPGKGKHEGRMGAVVVDFQGKELRVGTGFSDADRERDDLVGKIIEVEAMDYSADGLLREPRCKGFRYDKLEAD